MRRTHTLRAANGTYNNKEGEEKTSWITVGALMDKDGKPVIKFDSIPVGNTWDGWIQAFPVDEDSNFDDNIPF